jgi:hypothetical protein
MDVGEDRDPSHARPCTSEADDLEGEKSALVIIRPLPALSETASGASFAKAKTVTKRKCATALFGFCRWSTFRLEARRHE